MRGEAPVLVWLRQIVRHGLIIVFRSAKDRPFAERKATIDRKLAPFQADIYR
jgi:hypothetical protein